MKTSLIHALEKLNFLKVFTYLQIREQMKINIIGKIQIFINQIYKKILI